MPLETTCSSCKKQFSYLATKVTVQTGRCPSCQRDLDIAAMNTELDALNRRIDRILPKLKELNHAKILTKQAADEAFDAWEDIARVHAALDRKANIIAHEKDILLGAKELEVKKAGKKKSTSQTPEQKARQALKNLPKAVRAAILAQFNQAEED